MKQLRPFISDEKQGGEHTKPGFAVLRISITIIQINASLQNKNQTKKLICSH